MAAFKTITGSKVLLYLDLDPSGSYTASSAVGGATSGTLNISMDAIDCTNKDSLGRKEFIAGATSWTLDCEAYISGDGGTNASADVQDAMYTKDKVFVKFQDASGQASSKKYEGRGYITSMSQTGTIGEFATYSISIQGTGELSQDAV